MNTFVNKLLEYEERARQMVDEAKAAYGEAIRQVEAEQQGLRDEYARRAERHIAEAAEAAQAEAEGELRAQEESYALRAQALEQTWQQNAGLWRDQLTARCKRGG